MPSSTRRTIAALVACASLGGAGWALADSSTGDGTDAAPATGTTVAPTTARPVQDPSAPPGPGGRDCPEKNGAGGSGGVAGSGGGGSSTAPSTSPYSTGGGESLT